MVVRIEDSDDEYSSTFSNTSSNGVKNSKKTSTLKEEQQKKKLDDNHYCSSHTETLTGNICFSKTSKDLVGNFKCFRIETNKSELRVIGNGNRIYISKNTGDLQIIGNNTKVKIVRNAGQIRYTGNEGRISLGNDSIQQFVEYVGCNGVLKIMKCVELEKSFKTAKNSTSKTANKSDEVEVKSKYESTDFSEGVSDISTTNITKKHIHLVNMKSASFGDWPKIKTSMAKNTNHFKQNAFSSPNLKHCGSDSSYFVNYGEGCDCCEIPINNVRTNQFNDVIIKNVINVTVK